jgi:hypothetical protein
MNNLKKLEVRLPADFEETVWRSIATRSSRQAEKISDWGEALMRQPAWAMSLACVVLLLGLALGRFSGGLDIGSAGDQYVGLYTQLDNIL